MEAQDTALKNLCDTVAEIYARNNWAKPEARASILEVHRDIALGIFRYLHRALPFFMRGHVPEYSARVMEYVARELRKKYLPNQKS